VGCCFGGAEPASGTYFCLRKCAFSALRLQSRARAHTYTHTRTHTCEVRVPFTDEVAFHLSYCANTHTHTHTHTYKHTCNIRACFYRWSCLQSQISANVHTHTHLHTHSHTLTRYVLVLTGRAAFHFSYCSSSHSSSKRQPRQGWAVVANHSRGHRQ